MSPVYVLAWLLPIAAGICVHLVFDPLRGAGWRCTAVGYGSVLGLLLVSALTPLYARADTAHAWTLAAPWLVLVASVAALLAWRLRLIFVPPLSESTPEKVPYWKLALLIALLVSLVLRGLIALREIWLRPTYPWDAWSAWAVKPKTWFLLGHYVPYVSMRDWILQPDANLYTNVAWHYPNAIAWVEVWFASAAGSWIEPLVNLPWFALWIALLLGHYGQWRALGLRCTRALFFVYVLGSLPLLTVHAAIAGYADLWVAVLFGFAMLAWLRWLQQRDIGQLLLALVCAGVLPTLKLEGLVWAACLVVAIAFSALPTRWRWRGLICATSACGALFAFGGARHMFTLIGWTDATGAIVLPSVGPLVLAWHGDAALGTLQTLFVQPNWHLLWWIVLPVVVWRWRELVTRDWLWMPGLLLLVCLGLQLFLFLLTDASRWAQNFNAINRLVLQITPAVVTFLALLLRDARLPEAESDTKPILDRHIDQA